MCGIAGIFNLRSRNLPDFDPDLVLNTIRHRGPDDDGAFIQGGVFLGARRLAIIDPESGHQPVSDESHRFHLVMNGEIFDYDLFMKDLLSRGHKFRSHCDTEVLVHLMEEEWSDALDVVDGQYAIAVYDQREERFLLARDRMGICPLYYAQVGDYLVFASEMKAIFATGLLEPRINLRSLDAVLAFGATPAPSALFEGVRMLEPGHYLEARNGRLTDRAYWDIPYNDAGQYPRRTLTQWTDEFREVLCGASRRRLKADVPVGVYLSGGIDSATVASMVADKGARMQAFTIGFPEPGFDETNQALQLADHLGFNVHVLRYSQGDLARDLPELIHACETPLISTESVPMLALSRLARQHVKVVLSGEGSDEALGGYLYFRWEALKQGLGDGLGGWLLNAVAKPILGRVLGERNPFIPQPVDRAWAVDIFGYYPAIMMKFFYFRLLREMTYSTEMLHRQRDLYDGEFLNLPLSRMRRWDPYNRTLYLSSRIFMTSHLLASRGDRALMANSVEGRYPFLDRTVQEFMAAVPPAIKTTWLTDKYLLRRTMAKRLPKAVIRRQKKPFLAPFGTPFVGQDATDYIRDLLSPQRIRALGYFDVNKVQHLVDYLTHEKQAYSEDRGESMRASRKATERLVAGMALTFVVSAQILADQVSQGRFWAGKNLSKLQRFDRPAVA